MIFQKGDAVKVYDETEDEWFEGTILEVNDDCIMVEYTTKYWWHVKTVGYSHLRKE